MVTGLAPQVLLKVMTATAKPSLISHPVAYGRLPDHDATLPVTADPVRPLHQRCCPW